MRATALSLSAAGGPLLRRIRRLASASSAVHNRPIAQAGRFAVLAPLITAGIVFIVGSHLIATSVTVAPPRGLHDLATLSGVIYSALNVTQGNGNYLDALRHVIDTASPDSRSFDAGAAADFVYHTLRDPRPDALLEVQLPLTSVAHRLSHESSPQWPYRTLYVRIRLRLFLLAKAKEFAAAGDAEQARQYARAALLSAAQEAGLDSTARIAQVLRYESFAQLAQLSSRESARIGRALQDHRLILRLCGQERLRAVYSLRVLASFQGAPDAATNEEAQAARDALADALSVMLRASYGRPDIEWLVANVCWEARTVLDQADANAWRNELLSWCAADGPSSHRARWVEEAFAASAPAMVPYGTRVQSADELMKQTADWERRGMLKLPVRPATKPAAALH